MLGGFGKSASPDNLPITGLYRRGWYDDVSDGSVRATLDLKGTDTRQTVEPAWILIGVPRFAEPISAIVTMYKTFAYDVATRLPAPNTLVPPTEVSFTRDIYPVLFRAVMMRWVISTARMGHGSGAGGDFCESTQFDLLGATIRRRDLRHASHANMSPVVCGRSATCPISPEACS